MKPPAPTFRYFKTPLPKMSAPPTISGSSAPHYKPKKPQLTHFLCLPLHHAAPQLSHTLAALHADIVTNQELVPASAMRPVATMHLTLGVMALASPAHVQRAKEFVETGIDFTQLLHSLGPSSAAPLVVDLRGLETMGPRLRTSVLYAVPHDITGRLRAFAEAVRGAFEKEGLVVEEERELKLHVTLVNTIYSGKKGRGTPGRGGRGARGGRGGGGDREQPGKFDAEDLVDKYRDISFADGVRLDKVAVCRMGEVRREDGTSGGYLVCGERTF